MAHQGLNDKDVQEHVAKFLLELCPDLMFQAVHVQPVLKTNSSLRIGFVSTHFNDHSIGRILLETITYLDRNEFASLQKEIVVYSIKPHFAEDMQSFNNEHRNDTVDFVEAQYQAMFESRLVPLPINVDLIQKRIAEDQLDVLIFGDIGMDFATYALSFSRLASIQVRLLLRHNIVQLIDRSID
jgi:predicted O-linked N-acetylglucosamine transferase (SPINDLY family)